MGSAQRQEAFSDIGIVELDDEGFLQDFDSWNDTFADALALDYGIALDYEKLQIIQNMRDAYSRNGSIVSLRKMCRDNQIGKQRIMKLFGSCFVLWRLSGLPYPGEEARSYLS